MTSADTLRVAPSALDGVRVIDATQVLAGPFCTMLLGDLGADVVKIETPRVGDLSRRMHPRLGPALSGAFLTVNRNKRSVAIDLKHPDGLAVLHELVKTADVFVENFRPGVATRLGIGYETLSELNERLVYCSISGFGQTGPYAQRGGFDLIAQGMAGLMSVTGEDGQAPVKCGVPVTDLGAGLFAVYGVLAALHARLRTGRGQHVDTSLLEAGIGFTVWEATQYFYTGEVPKPTGSAHRLSAPYQALRTADGYITVGADSERHWPRLCRVIKAEHLLTDPRFVANDDRLRNLDALTAELESRTRAEPSAYWLEALEREGVAAGPLNTVPEALSDPHVVARGMVAEIEHPEAGSTRTIGPVVKFSDTPAVIARPAPTLGQHTADVLASAGYDESEIARLRGNGAFG